MAVNPGRGDVVLITGCSDGGIGAALCRAFHAAGCTVYATARRLDSMAELRAMGIRTLQLDVTALESAREAVAAVIREAGRIDILVNNAGIGLVAPLAEVDLQKAREVFDANYWGTLHMIQAAVPHMAARRAGLIANVGSVVGFVPTPWGSIYCASKAAVHSMTDVLRLELRPFGIRVVLLAPGAVQSNIGKNNLQRFDDRWELYAPFTDAIRARATLSQGAESMPTDAFARGAVRQLLRRNPPRHFLLGGMVGMIRLAMRLPLWLRDRMMAKKFGLNRALPLPPPPPPAAQTGAPAKLQGAGADGEKAD